MDELVSIGKREGLYVSTSTNAHHITRSGQSALY